MKDKNGDRETEKKGRKKSRRKKVKRVFGQPEEREGRRTAPHRNTIGSVCGGGRRGGEEVKIALHDLCCGY